MKISCFLLLALVLLFFSSASAQSLKFGVGAGINYGGLVSNHQFLKYKKQLGFFVNTSLAYKFDNKLSALVVPGIVQRKYQIELDGNSFISAEFNYIMCMLGLNYGISKYFSLSGGLEFGARVAARLISDNMQTGFFEFLNTKSDAGLLLGMNFQVFKGLGINLRMYQGFVSIAEKFDIIDPSGMISGKGRILNQTFSLGTSYMF